MNKPINVLWLDDKVDELLTDVSQSAKVNGVKIEKYFTNSTQAIDFIRSPEFDLDAIIIDGYFLKNKHSSSNMDITALKETIEELKKLLYRENVRIPFCVFTGHLDDLEGDSILSDIKVFTKGDDNKIMFDYLKKEVAKNEEKRIKVQYEDVFRVFNDEYIDSDQAKHLVKIFRSISTNKVDFEDELYFNRLRIILEYLFRAANKKGLLHDKCIQGHDRAVTISLSNRFLSGKSVDVLGIECTKTHFPAIIQDHVNDIIHITNIASHSESDEKEKSEKNLNEYRQTVNTPYLLYSLTFKLLDVLIWFKNYVDKNNDIETNKSYWKDISSGDIKQIEGKIDNKHPEGHFAFIKPHNSISSDENIYVPSQLVTAEIIKGLHVKVDYKDVMKDDGDKGREAVSIEVLS